MRMRTTIGCLVILGVSLLVSMPAHAQLGSSQNAGAMTPLPSMFNPSANRVLPGAGAGAFPTYSPTVQPLTPAPSVQQQESGATSIPGYYGGDRYSLPSLNPPMASPLPSFQSPQYQPAPSYGASPAPAPMPEKPFSGYRPPQAVSPYMDLYRSNADPGVNNYYSLVKPLLQQDAFMHDTRQWQQTQTEKGEDYVNGVLVNSWTNQSGQAGASTSGYGPTSYYMNFHGYYPALQPNFVRPLNLP
jgi:hypothetical protein